MMLRNQNSTTGGSHCQRLWIPLLVAFVAMCGFLWPLVHPERAATRLTPVEAASLPLTTMADLEVNLLGPKTVFAGEQITYTLVVQNKASDPAYDAVLIDTWVTNMAQDINTFWAYGVLPVFEGFHTNPPNAVISYTHQVNDANKRGEATWWLSPMMAGDSIEIVFTVTVPITLQPTLDNYLAAPLASNHRLLGPSTVENSFFAKVGEEIFSSNLSTVQVVAPLLLLTQSAIGEGTALNECRVGRLLTYTITIENVLSRADSWPATNLVVTKQLPVELHTGFVAASASVPGVTWTYSESIGTLVWQFMPTTVLTRGEKVYVYYTARVPADLSYNPRASYIETLGVPTGQLRARAALMPFREASLRSRHRVRILSPFDKQVATLSPPTHATTTFANRPVTYTLTYYSPISTTASTTFEDRLHDTFVFLHTAGGDLPTPVVNGPQLVWENVEVPGYGVISTTFVVSVTPETEVQAGGAACRYARYYNAITATTGLPPVPAYTGHNDNKLAELRVEPQLKVTKSVNPSSQMPGEEVTYQITVRNAGDTQIPAPIVITDVLPADFMFLRMGDNSPGDPLVDDKTLVWDSIPQLAPGDSFVFSFVAEVDGPIDAKVKNYAAADSTETPLCEISSAQVTILSPFVGDKFGESWNHETVMLGNNELPLVRQGDPLTYTASIYNRSPRTTYTITHFLDILDNESLAPKDRTGLVNSLDQSFEYLYTLPAPFVLDPDGQWEHTFGATMQGLGTGSLWCNNKEQIDKAKVEQLEGHVQFLMADGSVAFNPKKLAPIYVLPHVSMYQQAYPNPVAIGEVVTVVLTLRDNRTNPTVAVTGLDLQWTAPNDFTLLDANPAPTSSDVTSAFWSN
ncbi:MAG: DUF11 domain-containing protein, partial [Anaerolineae bacterium]|nr:DUF11 domain-containing protein [Anaerolineae bacterium]